MQHVIIPVNVAAVTQTFGSAKVFGMRTAIGAALYAEAVIAAAAK